LGNTARSSLDATEEYAKTKCVHGVMKRRCREAGIVFQPMIFESTGGVSAEAERVLKCLNKVVAVNFDASEVVVATRSWQGIGIDILRAGCRAFQRRRVKRDGVGSTQMVLFTQLSGLAVAGGV